LKRKRRRKERDEARERKEKGEGEREKRGGRRRVTQIVKSKIAVTPAYH